MYAIRRLVVAFALGALIFGAPVVLAAAPVPTLAQVLTSGASAAGQAISALAGIVGAPDLLLSGADTVDGYAGHVSINGGYATGTGVPGYVDIAGGFGNGAGSPGEIAVTGPDGAAGGNVDINSGNGYLGPGGTITLRPGQAGTTPGLVIITNLPTTNPAVPGALWNDNGTVKVSAG